MLVDFDEDGGDETDEGGLVGEIRILRVRRFSSCSI